MQKRAVRFAKMAILAAIPLSSIWATSTPPVGRSGAPGDTTCASCHNGAGSAKVALASTSGMTNYTPGASKHFTLTVSGSGGNAGFEITARPASNLTAGVAGNLVAGAGTQALCKVGTTCAAGNPQYIRSLSATATPATFDFDWTAPAGTEDVTLYVAAAVGYGGSTYTGTYLLKASGVAPPPTLSVAPASLSFSYQIGGSTPAAQSLGISGVATTYILAASGGTWLSVSPASGGTSGSANVSVSTAGLAAGSYSGSVTITAAVTTGSPKTVPVTFNVAAAAPVLTVSPASLTFAYQIGGTAPAAQTLNLSGVVSTFTAAASGGTWLSVSPASGSASVSVSTAGLAAGNYSGSVTITAAGATGSPKTVPVTFNVAAAAPTLTVSPASLSFASGTGGAAPAPQSIVIGGSLNYTAMVSGGTWLLVSPASGAAPGSVSVSVNTTGMVAGVYNATVTITAPGAVGGTRIVAVNLTLTETAPSFQITPGTLSFSCAAGNAAPLPFVISVASSGTALNYTAAASGGAWLSVAPASGATPGTLFVSVNPAGLAAGGTYTASITITSSNSASDRRTVPVTLTLNGTSTSACPVTTGH